MPESGGVLLVHGAPAPLQGELRPPGDKSISHRALILASLAAGRSRVEGVLAARDVEATLGACRQLGAKISPAADGALSITGVGGDGLSKPDGPLDMGNSGTAMRLLAGVLAAQPFDSVLTGDASLSRRPMRRIAAPLEAMGAVIGLQPDGCAPLTIEGGHALRGIDYNSPVASAQVKSCVLLAGLYASGETRVTEPVPSRDHTEHMLAAFGVEMPGGAVRGGSRLQAADLQVPADFSSAAFFMVAAAMVPGSRVQLKDIGLNPTRTGLLEVMLAMDCDVRVSNRRQFGHEAVGDLEIRYRAGLRGIDLPARAVPSMIDELPVLAALASRAGGTTRIRGAGELRVKESDRIAVMAGGLRALGVRVRERPDGMDIEGDQGSQAGVQRNGEAGAAVDVDAAGDHRCAMSFVVLAQALGRAVRIHGAAQIDTSYPGFADDLSALGGAVRTKEEGEHA